MHTPPVPALLEKVQFKLEHFENVAFVVGHENLPAVESPTAGPQLPESILLGEVLPCWDWAHTPC
jgi:hypothetical protein